MYVKYLFRMYGRKNGQEYERILSYHNCTDADYDEFYPVKKQSAGTLKAIRNDPRRGMFCLDWDDDNPIEITGSDIDADYTRFEIVMTPCNYLHTHLGYTGDSIDPSCNPNLED